MLLTETLSQNKFGKFQTKVTTSFKKGDLKKIFTFGEKPWSSHHSSG